MSYGRVRSLVLDICTSGVVQLKQGLIGPMKENWTQGLLAVILGDTLRGLKGISFMTLQAGPSLRRVMPSLLRIVGALKLRRSFFRRSM